MKTVKASTTRKKRPLPSMEFKYVSKRLYGLAATLGGDKYGRQLSDLYLRFWNPINYALVGGIGVIINYFMWILLAAIMPWFMTNAVAILVAWTWNWTNSVGPLGYLWGFKAKTETSVWQ